MPTKPEGVKVSKIGEGLPVFQEEPVYWNEDIRELYVDARSRYEMQLKKDGNWYAVLARPGIVKEDYFHGVFDLFAGVGINVLQTDKAYYAEINGGGGFTVINALNAGLRITTGGSTNNNNLFGTGDDSGLNHPFNKSSAIFYNIKLRWPEAADLTNTSMLMGFYYDADNYIALRFDTAVDGILRFVTRSGGNETLSELGTPTHDTWFDQQYYISSDLVRMYCECSDDTYEHEANLTTQDLAFYCKVQTLENAAKKFDIQHMRYVH